jgi:DNA-binding NarL/FixJ family response regulator
MTALQETSLIRVIVADDHQMVRSGITALLSAIDGVQVIAQAADGQQLIDFVEQLQPDVVMTDIEMPGIDGIGAIARIHSLYPEVRLVVLSMHSELDYVKRAVGCGACGYLMKNARAPELELALRSVMQTGSYFNADIALRLLQPAERTMHDMLTERQIEILQLIAQGKSAKEIGFKLGLSPKTVDVHRQRIMERLGLNDIASLTLYSLRNGLIKA